MPEPVVDPGTPAPEVGAGAPVVADPVKPAPVVNTGPTPAQKGGDDDARYKGLIADLQKERKARQAAETAATTHRAEYEAERRRVAALAGIQPKSDEELEAEAIRGRFKQVITRDHLLEQLGLTEEDVQDLKASRAGRAELARATDRAWERQGRETIEAFESEIAKELGGEKLSARQTAALVSAFVQTCNADPALLARYEDGDRTLIKEFAQQWVEDWFKPAQRKAQAANVDRFRPTPGGKDRAVHAPGGKAIDPNDPKAVEDLLVAGFRERGGRFGRE